MTVQVITLIYYKGREISQINQNKSKEHQNLIAVNCGKRNKKIIIDCINSKR